MGREGFTMIDFRPLETILQKRKRTYTSLVKDKIIGGGTLARLKAGQSISTDTINSLCNALRCKPSDIMRYIPDQTQGPE